MAAINNFLAAPGTGREQGKGKGGGDGGGKGKGNGKEVEKAVGNHLQAYSRHLAGIITQRPTCQDKDTDVNLQMTP